MQSDNNLPQPENKVKYQCTNKDRCPMPCEHKLPHEVMHAYILSCDSPNYCSMGGHCEPVSPVVVIKASGKASEVFEGIKAITSCNPELTIGEVE